MYMHVSMYMHAQVYVCTALSAQVHNKEEDDGSRGAGSPHHNKEDDDGRGWGA